MPDPELIQVARVIDQAEADLLVDCGVPCPGFPLRLPVHEEALTEEQAALTIRGLPAGCLGVLITDLDWADEIAAFCRLPSPRCVGWASPSVGRFGRCRLSDQCRLGGAS